MEIWTDGGCSPNPGKGGWGWHRSDGMEACGGDACTTNNRMELTAILEACKALPDGTPATIYSDSQYCVNGLTIWSAGWAKKNWMRGGEEIPNRPLWIALEEQKRRLRVSFKWVRGHNGHEGNEKADQLATKGRKMAS